MNEKDPRQQKSAIAQFRDPLDELIAAAWRDRVWRLKAKQRASHLPLVPDAWMKAADIRIRSYGWEDSNSQREQMSETIRASQSETAVANGSDADRARQELSAAAGSILRKRQLGWRRDYKLKEILGCGGQGVVFLTESCGADGFSLPLAMKVFFPWNYASPGQYERAMQRIAHTASAVARIRQPHLLDVYLFEQRKGVRLMLMELVDGYDLRRLLVLDMLRWLQRRLDAPRWKTLNDVTVTAGPERARVLPGPAVTIIRACLWALAALHRKQIVHGDIKPANIMLDVNGIPKIIDIGSAFEYHETPEDMYTLTWEYAAPEVHGGGRCTPQSDVTSLGYVLIEMLSGKSLFGNSPTREAMLEAKLSLPERLKEFLPSPVCNSRRLMELCRRMIEPDLRHRFASAEDADLDTKHGAHAFLLELYRGHLGAAWDHDIQLWIEGMMQ